MVIINKSVKPIQPLMPASMGFGSRIFDRYGWGGYYSWHALFMLFRNNPFLNVQGESEDRFPISLFLKFMNRPGKADISRLPVMMPKHLPGWPAGVVTQPIYIKTLQPGGSSISPGLTSLVYKERPYAVTPPVKESMSRPFRAEEADQGGINADADRIKQTVVKQLETRYDKGSTDKLVAPEAPRYYSAAVKEPGEKVTPPVKESMSRPFRAEADQGGINVDADRIKQTVVKQLETRYDRGSIDKLMVPEALRYYSAAVKEPGEKILSYVNIKEAGKPILYSYSDIINLFIRWSLINHKNEQPATAYPEKRRGVTSQVSGLEQAGATFNNRIKHYTTNIVSQMKPDIQVVSRRYQGALPVIPVNPLAISHSDYMNNASYQSYINYRALTQRVYGSAYKTGPDIHLQHIMAGSFTRDPIKQTQVNRVMPPYGIPAPRLFELIKRGQPYAVMQLFTAAETAPYPLPLRAGNQTRAGRMTGPDYSRNTVLQYLTENKSQPVYNMINHSGNDRYAPVSYTGLSHYINVIDSLAISTPGERSAPVFTDLFRDWMEILPGERPEARENRFLRTAGSAYGANAAWPAAGRASLINIPGIMPLLVPGGWGYTSIEQVPASGRSTTHYYRAGTPDPLLIYLQPGSKTDWKHPVFSAGTAALIHETRTVTRLNTKEPLILPFGYAQQAPYMPVASDYKVIAPGSSVVQRLGLRLGHSYRIWPGEPALRSPAQAIHQPVPGKTGRHSIQYDMISRQMPAIVMVHQMARLGLGLQSLLSRPGDIPARDVKTLKKDSRPNAAPESIYREKLVDQLYRYFEKERTFSNSITQAFKTISSSSGHTSVVTTGWTDRINLLSVNKMYLPAGQLPGWEHYQPAGGPVAIQDHHGKRPADPQMIYLSGEQAGFGQGLSVRSIAANTVHAVGQRKGSDAGSGMPGAEPETVCFGFAYSLAGDGRPYRQPAQQGLYAAARMVDLIIRRAAADTRDGQGSVSAAKDGLAGRPASKTAAQAAEPVSPARYAGAVPGPGVEHRLSVIQRYLANGETAYHTGMRPAMMIFRGQSGDSRPVAGLPGNLRTISPGQAIQPTMGKTADAARVLSSDAFRFPLYVFKNQENHRGAGSGRSLTGSPPGMVRQELSEQASADTRFLMPAGTGDSGRVYAQTGTRQVKSDTDSLAGRLLISRSVESMRLARERSRSMYSEPIHYAGSFAQGTMEHLIRTAPVSDQRNPAPAQVHIKTQPVQGAVRTAEASPLQRQQPERNSGYRLFNGLTHANIFQAMASGAAVKDSIFAAAAGAGPGARRIGIKPDSAMTGVVPPLAVGLEPKTMVFYRNQGQNAGTPDHRSVLQAMTRGVELNYRQEAAGKGRSHEPAAPAVTMEMVQAQIEASKAESPIEMSSVDIRSIANQVYGEIQRRIKKDRQCRGF